MIRNLCVFIDGTRQNRSKKEMATDSNVVRLYNATPNRNEGEVQQRAYYRKGVGTRAHETITGGALGFGLDERITEAKTWLDDECAIAAEDGVTSRIFLFGFSRGAFAVRVLASLLQREVEFLGVWDTVKATPGQDFGIAELPPYVHQAFHAMAIDEHRSLFDVFRFAPLERIRECWFSGSHTDVGGGYKQRELADITLRWMAKQAVAAGLVVSQEKIPPESSTPFPAAPQIHNEDSGGWCFTNLFRKMKWKTQRIIDVGDAIDDTVLFIRDHWKNLISNASLAKNNIYNRQG
ncbi:MAG: DUF2235 domain-containing protein [Lentisphaeria bacterium]|nr:DUF2235 domain-containing protein [Lentisphaeria bacterium]